MSFRFVFYLMGRFWVWPRKVEVSLANLRKWPYGLRAFGPISLVGGCPQSPEGYALQMQETLCNIRNPRCWNVGIEANAGASGNYTIVNEVGFGFLLRSPKHRAEKVDRKACCNERYNCLCHREDSEHIVDSVHNDLA